VDIGQKTLGARPGYCRGHSAALTIEPLCGAQLSAIYLEPYGDSTSHSTVETTEHAARLSKTDKLVAGYRQAINASQVAGYAFRQTL
jgi:hypothetical protein